MSLPARGAWIEIMIFKPYFSGGGSLPARGAWIEMDTYEYPGGKERLSLPARGAWIEIYTYSSIPIWNTVAPREGSVD